MNTKEPEALCHTDNSVMSTKRRITEFLQAKDSYSFMESKNRTESSKQNTIKKFYKCSTCYYVSSRKGNLIRHIQTHTAEKQYLFIHQKSAKTSHLETKKTQSKALQNKEKLFNCTMCSYKSKVERNLKIHLRTHTGEKPYTCDMCDYRSVQPSNLKTHKRTHTENLFECNLCDYKSVRASDFKLHQSTHTGEIPYKCVCGYKSMNLSSFKIHKKTHSGEKPYVCEVCNYKSALASSLRKHMRIHTGEKPFTCDICDYRTASSSNLKTHIRAHTGEKPYKCDRYVGK